MNANNRAREKVVNHNMKYQDHHRKHVECQPVKMKRDKKAIQDLQTCLEVFDADPFSTTLPTLRSLQSGLVALAELVEDFKATPKDGQTLVDIFLHEKFFQEHISHQNYSQEQKKEFC